MGWQVWVFHQSSMDMHTPSGYEPEEVVQVSFLSPRPPPDAPSKLNNLGNWGQAPQGPPHTPKKKKKQKTYL